MRKLCLILSLLGILALLFFINFTEPKIIKISSINQKYLDNQVKIIGISSAINTYKSNFTSFTLEDATGKINIICSCSNIKENQTLEIVGKISKYQGKLQIQADKIIIKNKSP